MTPEPVSVREALVEAIILVKPQAAERRVRLETLAGDLDCEVFASARRFRQVILNLLSNAVKFNREGGTISVSCEKIEGFLRIEVADAGRGIAAGNLAKLFVPFERLDVEDTITEGAGLGLSLSKHLIEAMGGRIGVESTLGQGTTFWVELPLIQATPAAAERSLDAAIAAAAEKPRCTAPRTAHIPIIMISADATAAQIARLRRLGAADYLTKPIDVRSFLAVVDGTEPRG